MYSRQYYTERYRKIHSDELLDLIVIGGLTREAEDAIHGVLKERGVSDEARKLLVHHTDKSAHRETGPSQVCDFCGKTLSWGSLRDGKQKFCTTRCLRDARLVEIGDDFPRQVVYEHALEIRNGPCPICGRQKSNVEVRDWSWVRSMLVAFDYGTDSKLCCKRCGTRSNVAAIMSSLFLGPWHLLGIFMVPVQIISNISVMVRPEGSEPSEALMKLAKLRLAETVLTRIADGPDLVET